MTDEKRQEMKEYKEKAIAYEHKFKGKRISLDSGVMTASTEMQKLDSYESPTIVVKEPVYCNVKDSKQNSLNNDSSISSKTLTLASEGENNNKISLNDNLFNKGSLIKSDNISFTSKFVDTLIPKQDSTQELTVTNSNICYEDNLNSYSSDTESINTTFQNFSLNQKPCDKFIENQNSVHLSTTTNSISKNENVATKYEMPRVRSNSYTLSSPSPIMVAFLNRQVQQQIMEPKLNLNYIESKSEPSSICLANECKDNFLKTKSISLHSIHEPFLNQDLTCDLVKYEDLNVVDRLSDNKIISDQKQDERGSVITIGTNFSNDDSVVGSVITVYNGNSFENNTISSPSSTTCKSTKHCCCRHSDDEYSLSSANIHYKTPEELNKETERLRLEKLDIERRHQEELSNLIKKQRQEQEQIAVKYYLISQSSSGMSLDDSDCSELFSKRLQNVSPSIHSGMTITNDNSILSDTSPIISNCSVNKTPICSSPRQKTPSRSPYLQQNIKFYHRMRGGTSARWTKAPTEVENAAATVINASARGYLTRRLLRTEKAQLLKKTILDSLKTALMMHMELKKQQPTETDLELHRRIINQVTILNCIKVTEICTVV